MLKTVAIQPNPRTALSPTQPARPFVKWAGGKGQLIPHLRPRLPKSYRRYVEPFVGGGAVFFSLQPGIALIADANPDLVEVYKVVRDSVDALIVALDRHQPNVLDQDYYYDQRSSSPDDAVERAARFIFLNKTCYNGLYRVNRRGQFNVPFGRYKRPPGLYDADNLRRASALLQPAEIRRADFEDTLAEAGQGDFVYLDPPYDPLSATANFTGYTKGSFGRDEQARLARATHDAAKRGAKVLLNNSDTPLVRELYRDFHLIEIADLRRAINSDPTKRRGATELILTNYKV